MYEVDLELDKCPAHLNLGCIERGMSLCRGPGCTIQSTVPFLASSFDCNPDCIHIHLGMIFPNIFQRPLIYRVDMIPDLENNY